MENELREQLTTSTGIDLPETNWKIRLIDEIQYLMQHDFHKLKSILYRMDVSEGKLRGLLQENPEKDAAEVIAELMIERAIQRQQTREQYGRKGTADDTEETW